MAVSPTADHQANISGRDFERLVADLLRDLGAPLADLRIVERETVEGVDGRFEVDATARFTAFGANFLVLIECKDHSRPVGREYVQVLADRVRSTGAQKAMLFSTNGFQSGAIEYARKHGIALIRVLEGALTWETRGYMATPSPPPPWANIPAFVLQHIRSDETGTIRVSTLQRESSADLLISLIEPVDSPTSESSRSIERSGRRDS